MDFTYHNPTFAQNWDVTSQISYLDTSQEVERNLVLFPPGANLGFGVFPDGVIGNPEVFERHARLDLSAFYTRFDRHLVRVGAGFNYGSIYDVRESKNFGLDPATGAPLPPSSPPVDVTDTPFVFLRDGDRRNYYFFLQDAWNFANDWELTTGGTLRLLLRFRRYFQSAFGFSLADSPRPHYEGPLWPSLPRTVLCRNTKH